jgi:hypothetical protein
MSSICTKTLVPGFDEQAQLMWQRFDAARSMTHTCEKQVGYAAPAPLHQQGGMREGQQGKAHAKGNVAGRGWQRLVGVDTHGGVGHNRRTGATPFLRCR